jgi:hypothetical protein
MLYQLAVTSVDELGVETYQYDQAILRYGRAMQPIL